MKILLLGGTGAMGSHLVNILSERGDKVVITSRSPRKSKELIEYQLGDAKDLDFLNFLLQEQWDAIIDFMIYTEVEFKGRVDLLLDATTQYVFLSSARVYANNNKLIIEKSSRLLDTCNDKEYLVTNEYALSKARQENILFLSNKKNWTIVRPYITYSEVRLQVGTLEKENWLYRALKGRTIVFSEDMKNHFTTLTYGLDVSKAIVELINNTKAVGEIYHITSNSSYKWDDILNIYLDVLEEELGGRPKVIYQDLSEYLSWSPKKHQVIYDRLFDRKFDNSKINLFINTSDFVDVREGLVNCLKDFLKNPKFKYTDWKQEAIKDKFTKEATPLKEIDGMKQKIKYLLFRYVV